MLFYRYKAKDIRGHSCSGTLRAEDEEDARRQLERRRLEVLEIEEDREASARVSEATLSMRLSQKKKTTRLWEFLSYAMPAGAAVLAIAGVLLMVNLIKPALPDRSPEKVLEEYFQLENTFGFEKQYALFSPARQKNYKSKEDYSRQRKTSMGLSGQAAAGKWSGARELVKEPRRARYEVKILRPTGVDTVEVSLTLSRGHWGIDSVRDPAWVNVLLDRLIENTDEARRRLLKIELKRESGYSDLEIDNLLRQRRMDKKRQEVGTDNLFF